MSLLLLQLVALRQGELLRVASAVAWHQNVWWLHAGDAIPAGVDNLHAGPPLQHADLSAAQLRW